MLEFSHQHSESKYMKKFTIEVIQCAIIGALFTAPLFAPYFTF